MEKYRSPTKLLGILHWICWAYHPGGQTIRKGYNTAAQLYDERSNHLTTVFWLM
jgi:hypothetical protein